MAIDKAASNKVSNHFVHLGNNCVAFVNLHNHACTNAADASSKHLAWADVLFERSLQGASKQAAHV